MNAIITINVVKDPTVSRNAYKVVIGDKVIANTNNGHTVAWSKAETAAISLRKQGYLVNVVNVR